MSWFMGVRTNTYADLGLLRKIKANELALSRERKGGEREGKSQKS